MKNVLDKDIFDRCNEFKSKYQKVLKMIEKYDHIAVFRHVKPDYDALGCQLAMVSWIKDNFPQKEVIYTGEDHITLTPRCFPEMMKVDDSWFREPFLSIVLDTSNADRIADQRYKLAKEIIKIDHHPQVEKYGKVEIVDTTMSAAGELLANMLFRFDAFKISKTTASYLYKAIVGDSNRFLYSDVSVHTFAVAKELLHLGIDMVGIYKEMYSEDLSSLEFTKWVLSHYHISKKGVAYYVLEKEDLAKLKLKPEQGKECLYLFDHFDDVHIWASISYDEEKNVYRVSLRSDGASVESVASKYMGGGHTQASGAKLKSLDELPNLIADLEKLLD
ncbi:MAG: bifunctional oligoribonuclease/PAP phosphatase NrnA [Bacilli bacterium]|nr:bifunctional oligoribonuclease/PAP phosphatase NrnA [Bacilli bacterium]